MSEQKPDGLQRESVTWHVSLSDGTLQRVEVNQTIPPGPAPLYERFTDRARKVMQLANQEAYRWNHDHVGTEHVLLGLVKEGSGLAAHVLQQFGLTVANVRAAAEKYIKPGPDVVIGRLPHTPRTKRLIENAVGEARHLKHNHVGTEHLLLGLLDPGVNGGPTSHILRDLKVDEHDVRCAVLELLECPQTAESEADSQPAQDDVAEAERLTPQDLMHYLGVSKDEAERALKLPKPSECRFRQAEVPGEPAKVPPFGSALEPEQVPPKLVRADDPVLTARLSEILQLARQGRPGMTSADRLNRIGQVVDELLKGLSS